MQPNNPNSIQNFFGIKISKPGINVANASDKQLVYKDNFSSKTYYDASNSRMIEGQLPDGSYGLWVSKPGFDVTTATNNQLVFNSNQDMFKIAGTIQDTISGTDNSGSSLWAEVTQTYAHGLGIVPVVLGTVLGASSDHPGEARLMPAHVYVSSASAYPFQMSIVASADSGTIYVHLSEGPSVDWSAQTISFKLYLLQETAV